MLSKEKKRILVFAFITLFLDSLNYGLIVPILPYLMKELHSTSMQEGVLFSSYAVTQLLSLLFMGPGSDIFGRKPFLLLSLFGSCFGSLFQAMSNSMWALIVWRSFTGLLAGSLILVQAIIADLVPAEERNVYLSRLNACETAAYILGPLFGGILGQVNNHFPLYVAGIASGIAMIIAFCFLKESNPVVLQRQDVSKQKTEKKAMKREKPHLSSTMLLCFIFEFCLRWTVNAFDARYGIYLTDLFNTPSIVFSTLIIIQSILCCIFQSLVYPWLSETRKIPIPYLAFAGMVIEFFSYLAMTMDSEYGSMTASIFLWIGFNMSSPTAVSILSTTTHPSVQGLILSYDNFFLQASRIISPLVLSAIYVRSKKWTYYFSSFTALIAVCIMGYICTWRDVEVIGKKSMYQEKDMAKKEAA